MITSQKVDIVRILDFQDHKQGYDLNAKEAAIDVIAQKEKFTRIRQALLVENVQQVEELTVNVANDANWTDQPQDVGLEFYFREKFVLKMCYMTSKSDISFDRSRPPFYLSYFIKGVRSIFS